MKDWFRKYHIISVFCVYLVLTLFMSVVLVININSQVPGVPGDTFQVLADANEQVEIIKNSSFLSFLTTNWNSPFNLFKGLTHLSLLQALFGQPLAYNIWWLSSFLLAALFSYLLINYLVKNKLAAFIGGIIYSFAPTHFAFGLGFIGATHIEWIPLFVLFLFKYFRKPTIKHIIFLLISFLLIIVNEPHFAAYSVLFSIGVLLYFFLAERELCRSKRFKIYSSVTLILSATLLIVIYYPLIATDRSEQNYLAVSMLEIMQRSFDVASFIVPFGQNSLWGDFFAKNVFVEYVAPGPHYPKAASEVTGYIGFTVLFLILFGVIIRKKNKQIIFWSWTSLIFSILALGPFLYFFGLIEPKIPLPYIALLKYIPFFDNIRATGRIFIIALLAIAVLASFGVKYLLEKRFKDKSKIIIISLISILLIVEYSNVLETTPTKFHEFYRQLTNDKEQYGVVLIPSSTCYVCASMFDYNMSITNKNEIGGRFYARDIPGAYQYEKNTPAIKDLLYAFPDGKKMNNLFIQYDLAEISNVVFNRDNIKYIVIDKNYIKTPTLEKYPDGFIEPKNFIKLCKLIEANLSTEKVIDDSELLVYKIIKEPTDKYLILVEGNNWNEIMTDENKQESSWMTNDSTLILDNHAPSTIKVRLSLKFSSLDDNNLKKMEVYHNDNLEGTYLIGSASKNYIFFIDNIIPGENFINFKIYDQNNDYIEPFTVENDQKVYAQTILAKNITYEEVQQIEYPAIYQKIDNSSSNDRSIISMPAYSSYDFGSEEEYENNKVRTNKIVDFGYYVPYLKNGNKTPDIEGDYQMDWHDFYSLMPLVYNRIDFNEININFDIFNRDYFNGVGENLTNKYNIGYLVAHKKYLSKSELDSIKKYVPHNIIGSGLFYEDKESLAYKFKQGKYNPRLVRTKIGDGWGELFWDLHPYYRKSPCQNQCREIKSDSTLNLINESSENIDVTLNFTVNTRSSTPQFFYLSQLNQPEKINRVPVGAYKNGQNNVSIEIDDLLPGYNKINFSGSSPGIFISNFSVDTRE